MLETDLAGLLARPGTLSNLLNCSGELGGEGPTAGTASLPVSPLVW